MKDAKVGLAFMAPVGGGKGKPFSGKPKPPPDGDSEGDDDKKAAAKAAVAAWRDARESDDPRAIVQAWRDLETIADDEDDDDDEGGLGYAQKRLGD